MWLLLFLLPVTVISQCPQTKTVGEACFTLSDKEDTTGYQCTSNCTYLDKYGEEFCFKDGPYHSQKNCNPPSEPSSQVQPGEKCRRDCTKSGKIYTCVFNFTLEQQYSDTQGRLADGLNRSVLVYNGQLPGPTIAVCEGDNVVVNLENKLTGDEFMLGAPFKESGQGPDFYLLSDVPYNSTTLHFHGIREKQFPGSGGAASHGPWSDGVPMVSQCPVLSGDKFVYTFLGSGGISSAYNNAPAGTYWYHSHMGRQRMNGAEGKLIIMPRTSSNRVDVDLPENSLFLQEWYPNTTDATPQSILVNGKGKQHPQVFQCIGLNCLTKYKHGKFVEFEAIANPNYDAGETQPNYEVFNITKTGRHRFRIIGGIGDNVPIRVSVENHTFTAIAMDSVDIEPVENLDALWVSAGERFDIVVNLTEPEPSHTKPLRIFLFHGITKQAGAKITICSLAWLKFPDQIVDHTIEADCEKMRKMEFKNVLNPAPTDFSKWGSSEGSGDVNYIYPVNLTSVDQAVGIEREPLNTQYISMHGMKFNNFSMSFPKNYSSVPFLFQSPSSFHNCTQCGVTCQYWDQDCQSLQPDDCGESFPPTEECDCQHLIQQPWLPWQSLSPKLHWFETILINVDTRDGSNEDGNGVAHPIHQHGGWFNILGMGQFNRTIFREDIMEMDKNCINESRCLPRNYDHPVFKDVIQVPTNGYVIMQTPVDNRGMWIVHCHINWHVEHGMAMVFQIGEPDGPFRWAMGRDKASVQENTNKVCFPSKNN